VQKVSSSVAAVITLVVLVGCGKSDRGRTVAIYFVDGQIRSLGTRGQLTPVHRNVKERSELPRAVVIELLRGPSPHERRRGLISLFPSSTRLEQVMVAGQRATVDLTGSLKPRKWPDSTYAAGQLLYSMTELAGIQSVLLRFDGRVCCVYDLRSRVLRRPLTRRTFAAWQGAPA